MLRQVRAKDRAKFEAKDARKFVKSDSWLMKFHQDFNTNFAWIVKSKEQI